MPDKLPNKKVVLFTRYPLSSILLYNGITVLHYLLGGTGIILGYRSWYGLLFGSLYVIFAFLEMYILMPLKTCPNCVYYKLDNSVCISALNLVSRRLTGEGDVKDFSKRSRGILCNNNLYLASLAIPILALIPALIIHFNLLVLLILLVMVGLLVFRFFFIFTNIACLHCRGKNICPNAQAMGLSEKQPAQN
jgi:hypothetical protein